jgi:CHAD domain-containing protein
MAFAFEHGKGVAGQVRDIAREQLEKAIEEASGTGDFDATVHAVRRRCKKLRGLLRLVQPRFETFGKENRALRDAANALGASRDAAVAIETFDGLVTEAGGDFPSGAIGTLREHLLGRLSMDTDHSETLARFVRALEAVERRVDKWQFSGHGVVLITEGLGLTYGRLRKGGKLAHQSGIDEDLHDWRKHVKHHLYHVSLLRRAAPEALKPRLKMMDTLGELLGDHHNLSVLRDTLGDGAFAPDMLDAVNVAIGERQADLAAQAFALGDQLTVEKPKALERRFAGYWDLLD